MTSQTIQSSRAINHSPIYYGWVIWAVATLGIIGSAPGQAFTISLFNNAFIADFGLSRTTVSGLFGLGTFTAALSLTWVGRLIDQYGNRKVGLVIGLTFSLVLVSLSVFITGPLTLFVAFVALRFLGQGGMGLVNSTAIAKWWVRRRGWVMGLALVAFALFQSVYLTGLQSLIETFGWRATWIILGLCVGVLVMPVWWLLMRDQPEKYGRHPDGDVAETASLAPVAEDNWTLGETMRTPIFWIFLLGRIVSAGWGTGLVFHQVSVFASLGHNELMVARMYGITAIVNAVITLALGRFIGRLRPGYVMAFQLSLIVSAMLLAISMKPTWMLSVYAVIFGMAMAFGASFDGSVWADMFGRLHHGAIRGFVTTVLVIGTSFGPVIFGLSYDHLGGYTPVLLAGVALAFIPLIGSLFSRKPPHTSLPMPQP